MKKLLLLTLMAMVIGGCEKRATHLGNPIAHTVIDAYIERQNVIHDSLRTDTIYKLIRYNSEYFKYKSLRDEMEILYLRTENDKYRIMGNRYEGLRVKFAKLAARFSK